MAVDLLHDEGRSRASWSCAIFLLAPQPDRARVTMMHAHAGKLTLTPFCLSLRLLRHPPSLHIHLKRTSMCGFSLNPPPPPPPLSLSLSPVDSLILCSPVPGCVYRRSTKLAVGLSGEKNCLVLNEVHGNLLLVTRKVDFFFWKGDMLLNGFIRQWPLSYRFLTLPHTSFLSRPSHLSYSSVKIHHVCRVFYSSLVIYEVFLIFLTDERCSDV